MLDLSNAIREHLQTRGGRGAHLLVSIDARNRDTNLTENVGFWTGADHEDFTIGGLTRTYHGAGTLLSMTPLVVETGLRVRRQRLIFSKVAPEVQLAMRGYDVKDAAVRIYVRYQNRQTHQQIDEPVRRFKGKVAGLKFTREKKVPGKKASGAAKIELTLQSNAVKLTNTLALKKSDEALQARAPGDRLRRFADISGSIPNSWGELSAKASDVGGSGSTPTVPLIENTDR